MQEIGDSVSWSNRWFEIIILAVPYDFTKAFINKGINPPLQVTI